MIDVKNFLLIFFNSSDVHYSDSSKPYTIKKREKVKIDKIHYSISGHDTDRKIVDDEAKEGGMKTNPLVPPSVVGPQPPLIKLFVVNTVFQP